MNRVGSSPWLRSFCSTLSVTLCMVFSIGWLLAPEMVRRGRNVVAAYFQTHVEPLHANLSGAADPRLGFIEDSSEGLRRFASLAALDQADEDGHGPLPGTKPVAPRVAPN